MVRDKFVTADQAAAWVGDRATVVVTGAGGGLVEPAAVERRFLEEGHPRDLTVVHALGVADGKTRGMNCFAHEAWSGG
jgi:acyl CoA:acetate/3-ketoacid CoA transferase